MHAMKSIIYLSSLSQTKHTLNYTRIYLIESIDYDGVIPVGRIPISRVPLSRIL